MGIVSLDKDGFGLIGPLFTYLTIARQCVHGVRSLITVIDDGKGECGGRGAVSVLAPTKWGQQKKFGGSFNPGQLSFSHAGGGRKRLPPLRHKRSGPIIFPFCKATLPERTPSGINIIMSEIFLR